VNGIVSLALLYKIPLLMLISHRGDLGERDPWQCQGGMATVPVLRALGIPHYAIEDPDRIERSVLGAQRLAQSSLTPVALLLSREVMWEET
jgi:sulfopyruvate decarboxylase subunit alpha